MTSSSMCCNAQARFVGGGLLALTGLVMSGCAVTPEPLTEAAMQAQAEGDVGRLTLDQVMIVEPVDLYEAMARALTYNLDLRVELMNETLSGAQLELAKLAMLPQLVGELDYTARNKFNAASSQSFRGGGQSLEPSFSSNRDVLTGDLRLSWNILDFGVSYYRAKQASDQTLIAQEQTQRVLNRILEDVRTAYWRAVSNERLQHRMDALMTDVEQALGEMGRVERRKLRSPLVTLTAQRELLGIKRELLQLRRNLQLGKLQLAALMNVKPGQAFTVATPSKLPEPRVIDADQADLERQALLWRPELRENVLRKRINAHETRAALLELLPGIELNVGVGYSNNSFLENNNWLSIGANVAGNLLDLVRYPARKRELAARDALLDTEGLALSMAVLTQVNVSLAQYRHAQEEYHNAEVYSDTQLALTDVVRSREQTRRVSRQTLIREEMNALVAEVQRDVAFADMENGYAAVQASIGARPLPEALPDASIDELAQALREHWQ
ncbi:MAG: TolC family protein [Gammaproteobacteria bacterium]